MYPENKMTYSILPDESIQCIVHEKYLDAFHELCLLKKIDVTTECNTAFHVQDVGDFGILLFRCKPDTICDIWKSLLHPAGTCELSAQHDPLDT